MNKRAAELYLNKIFGDREGHVAVAYKGKAHSWNEQSFAWPAERNKLLAWSANHEADDVFICPALRRDAHTRKKKDMHPSRWLWADVDWQGVPHDRVADVKARISDLGGLVVRSGSGDNVHVYVELSRPVEHGEFIKLNTGLRDYLYADNKQADNSLLRLPGTTNWKTDAGSPVEVWNGKAQVTDPAALVKIRAFRDAKVPVEAEATEWSFVEVPDVPRRIKSMVNMPVEEAIGRYGKRYKAVRGVVNELHKRGFSGDQIHSLMDKFPAALDKMAEENGYDLHLDVDRCLSVARATSILTEEQAAEIEEEAFEIATEEDDHAEREERILRLALVELERSEARKRARMLEAERTWVGPPPGVSWSLDNALKHPPRPVPHLIAGYETGEGMKKGLAGAKHNVVITAQYKTGKTVFVMGSLARSLCDGVDFLNRYPVNVPEDGAVVGHWNCEMDPDEMLDDYIRPVGIQNTSNLNVANLRGYPVNILSEPGKRWAVSWLKGEIPDERGNYPKPCKVWTIDSFARVARMAGVSEKDNDEVMGLLMALDQIKVEAEVDAIFLITHTGRAEMEEGKERARGATAIDDWADARWIMTKVDQVRFLAVEGRSVGLETTSLHYDDETKRYEMGYGGKAEVRAQEAVQVVVKVVKDNPGIVQAALLKILAAEPFRISQRVARQHIEEAIDGNFVEIREVPLPQGGRKARQHWMVGQEKPEGDRSRRATPADVDMRAARSVRRRKTP